MSKRKSKAADLLPAINDPTMSMSKTKSYSSTLQSVYNNEVGACLGRLIDSVVAERASSFSTSQPQAVKKCYKSTVTVEDLPDEMLVEIFRHLNQNKLGEIARVCRKWSVLSRTSVLWEKVDVKFFLPCESQNEVVINFISMLPPCVTCVSLDFITPFRSFMFERLKFEEICKMLHEKCPRLEGLILSEANLSSLSPLADLCTVFLCEVKILALGFCSLKIECDLEAPIRCSWSNDDAPKIKCLDFYNCNIEHFGKYDLLKMPNLEQLHLHNTPANDYWFIRAPSFLSQLHILDLSRTRITSRSLQIIRNFGHNLEKLYLCDTGLRDEDIDFSEQMLPKLNSICLSYCGVTCFGVVSLIQTCETLENVYVKQDLVKECRRHPFVAANRNKSKIVKAAPWNHEHLYKFE